MTPGIARDWLAARASGLTIPQWRAARAARLDLLPSRAALSGGLVVDVGANVGDWTAALLCVAPKASVIAVEPARAPCAILARRFGADPRVTVEPRALAAAAGEQDFYVTDHSHNASLHVPRSGMAELYGPGWDVASVTRVPTTTIDDLAGDRPIALLKIDVQGAEREVLAGATRALPRIGAVLMEVTFISHYEGDATFPWLHEHMAALGFELASLSSPYMSRRHTALWCDACYVRALDG